MWRTPLLVACVVVGGGTANAERAASPADATVFIRLVGSVHAELEEPGSAKQTIDLARIEIGTGSGFVISPYGYVLTSEHVISNSEFTVTDGPRQARMTLKVSAIEVCLPAGVATRGNPARCFNANVHSSDAELDLAVLFVSADLPYVALGDSDVVSPGQPVDALGYPFGRQLEVGRIAAPDLVPELSVSAGTISALRAGDTGERRVLQINSTINPGNSGGPIVDRDGYAVGVIRARIRGDAGIGFAVPINLAKDFIGSRGLDAMIPPPRLQLGPLQRLDSKGVALKFPDGIVDTSPSRARVENAADASGVALRIDRVVSPWSARQIEQTLMGTEAFERISVDAHESRPSPSQPAGKTLLLGRATGTSTGNRPLRMQYAILELGTEKLVARYVGPAEYLAYNERVLRDSLASLEGQPLVVDSLGSVDALEWSSVGLPGELRLPVPVGWVVEPGVPVACTGLPQAGAALAMYPARELTLALRAAAWSAAPAGPQAAAAACSSRRGSAGDTSYSQQVEWLGVSYVIEGLFLQRGSGQLLQLEVISPVQKTGVARALLAAWVDRAGRR